MVITCPPLASLQPAHKDRSETKLSSVPQFLTYLAATLSSHPRHTSPIMPSSPSLYFTSVRNSLLPPSTTIPRPRLSRLELASAYPTSSHRQLLSRTQNGSFPSQHHRHNRSDRHHKTSTRIVVTHAPKPLAEPDCPICLMPYETCPSREPAVKIRCGHIFGLGCLKHWFRDSREEVGRRCPMCRAVY